MFSQVFYHQTIRKMTIVLGTLFNNVFVSRKNAAGVELERIRVPLAYASKEKSLRRLRESSLHAGVPEFEVILPRMGFFLDSINYDTSRKQNSMIRKFRESSANPELARSQYMEVPYTLEYSLHIMTKTTDDGLQILEQILPYFAPDFVLTANLIPDFAEKVDIPIILTSVSSEEDFEGDLQTRRSLIWTLNFSMKSYMYAPVSETGIIRKSIATIFDQNGPVASTFNYADGTTGANVQTGALSKVTITPNPLGVTDGGAFTYDTEIRVFGMNGIDGIDGSGRDTP